MTKLLNILHYSIYLTHYKLHLIANRLNPFRLLHKLPFQKKKYEELGINIDQEVNNAFSNKDYGLSILVSGGALIGIVFLLLFSFCNFIVKLIDVDFILDKPIFIGLGILSFLLCFIFVFRKDKYLKYFQEFEEWGDLKTRRNIIISIFSVIVIIILFFLSILKLNW